MNTYEIQWKSKDTKQWNYAGTVKATSVAQAKRFFSANSYARTYRNVPIRAVLKVKSNPNPALPKNKWIKAKAVKVMNGKVLVKR